jgi:hypothetical protein
MMPHAAGFLNHREFFLACKEVGFYIFRRLALWLTDRGTSRERRNFSD